MYNNQNNKKGERNWVKEYNESSFADKMVMDYEQRRAAEVNNQIDENKRVRAAQRARNEGNRLLAYTMATPEERARHDKIRRRNTALKLGAVAIFLGIAYYYLGVFGVIIGGIVASAFYNA